MFNLKNTFIFIAGVTAGAAASYIITKQKYEEILEEEIASVKETYKNRQELVIKDESEEVVEDYKPSKEDKEEYNSILENSGYVNYTKYMNGEEKNKTTEYEPYKSNNDNDVIEECDMPYIIQPEEFGEDGYDTQTLTYYSDGVLVDDLDDVIEDINTVVGIENLKIFEEFGARSVTVRNEIWRVDFEIIKDDWKYSDIDSGIKTKEEIAEYYKDEDDKKPHEL